MKRHIHYEAAFEDFLRRRGVPYVPVEEARRVVVSGERVKSFDFIVYPGAGRQWLVDIKGRQFPYINERGAKRYWENWVTQEDLDHLAEWEQVFGGGYEARLVFAYLLEGPPDRWPAIPPHLFRGEAYLFYAVRVEDYRAHARRRSSAWDTVAVNARTFRRIAQVVELSAPDRSSAQADRM